MYRDTVNRMLVDELVDGLTECDDLWSEALSICNELDDGEQDREQLLNAVVLTINKKFGGTSRQ